MWRPRVYAQLVKAAYKIDDVGDLINFLDLVPKESAGEQSLRIDFHQLLQTDLSAVFTMMCKAEAWMGAASERQKGWGGARKGAGRSAVKKVPVQ